MRKITYCLDVCARVILYKTTVSGLVNTLRKLHLILRITVNRIMYHYTSAMALKDCKVYNHSIQNECLFKFSVSVYSTSQVGHKVVVGSCLVLYKTYELGLCPPYDQRKQLNKQEDKW